MMYKRTARVKRFLKINDIIYICIYIYLYMPGQTESTLTTPQVRNIRCTEQVHVNNCKDVCCYPFFRISTRIFRMYLLPAASRLAEPMFGTSISCGIATDAPVAGYLRERLEERDGKGEGRRKKEENTGDGKKKYLKYSKEIN